MGLRANTSDKSKINPFHISMFTTFQKENTDDSDLIPRVLPPLEGPDAEAIRACSLENASRD